jgi:hypothetical protein
MRTIVALSVFIVLAAYTAGCSFSASSKGSSKSSGSISDSVSSPFKSSSNSSPQAYEDDVKDFTASYIKSGGNAAQLEQEIGKIAEEHGVSDWENDEDTYVGIGKGLHKAGLNQAELDGYKSSLGATGQKAEWIQDGYDERK